MWCSCVGDTRGVWGMPAAGKLPPPTVFVVFSPLDEAGVVVGVVIAGG